MHGRECGSGVHTTPEAIDRNGIWGPWHATGHANLTMMGHVDAAWSDLTVANASAWSSVSHQPIRHRIEADLQTRTAGRHLFAQTGEDIGVPMRDWGW